MPLGRPLPIVCRANGEQPGAARNEVDDYRGKASGIAVGCYLYPREKRSCYALGAKAHTGRGYGMKVRAIPANSTRYLSNAVENSRRI